MVIVVALASLLFPRTGAIAAAVTSDSPGLLVPPCVGAQLTVWMGLPGADAAGSAYYQVEFSNTAAMACSLYGFPGISGVSDRGTQLGAAARWGDSFVPAKVVLAPGETAHAVLQVANVYNFPPDTCKPTTSTGLRIYPPAQDAAAAVLPFITEACKSGSVYLTVEPVSAGTGIPRDSR
jgi:hypothetical protein